MKYVQETRDTREDKIRQMAKSEWCTDEISIDANAEVSEGDDNGAYVAAWVWVSFYQTDLDKARPGNQNIKTNIANS